jgi:hypothetical protein
MIILIFLLVILSLLILMRVLGKRATNNSLFMAISGHVISCCIMGTIVFTISAVIYNNSSNIKNIEDYMIDKNNRINAQINYYNETGILSVYLEEDIYQYNYELKTYKNKSKGMLIGILYKEILKEYEPIEMEIINE